MKKFTFLLVVVFMSMAQGQSQDTLIYKKSEVPVTLLVPDSVWNDKANPQQNYFAWTKKEITVISEEIKSVKYKMFSRQFIFEKVNLYFDKDIGKNLFTPVKRISYPSFAWELILIFIIFSIISYKWIKNLRTIGGDITDCSLGSIRSRNSLFLNKTGAYSFAILVVFALISKVVEHPVFFMPVFFIIPICIFISFGFLKIILGILDNLLFKRKAELRHSYLGVLISMIILIISLVVMFGFIIRDHLSILFSSLMGIIFGIIFYSFKLKLFIGKGDNAFSDYEINLLSSTKKAGEQARLIDDQRQQVKDFYQNGIRPKRKQDGPYIESVGFGQNGFYEGE